MSTDVIFWTQEAKVDEQMAFQLSLAASAQIPISKISFTELVIHFAHESLEPLVIERDETVSPAEAIQRVHVGHVMRNAAPKTPSAKLRWDKGGVLVITGSVSSHLPGTIAV